MYDKARKIHSADTFPPKTDFLLCAMFNDKHRPEIEKSSIPLVVQFRFHRYLTNESFVLVELYMDR